jgi:hypothetical protein
MSRLITKDEKAVRSIRNFKLPALNPRERLERDTGRTPTV